MIARLVSFALRQRFLIIIASVALMVWGAISFGKLPIDAYRFDWGGEYKEYLASREQMKIIVPLTVLLILLILFALYGNLKFPLIIFFSVLVTEPVGGLAALWITHTN